MRCHNRPVATTLRPDGSNHNQLRVVVIGRCLVITVTAIVSEETSTGGSGFFLFLLFFFHNSGGRGVTATSASTRSGKLGGILEVFLVLVGNVKGVGRALDGEGQDHLEGIDDRVGNGSLGRVSGGERDRGQNAESLAELSGEDVVGDLQDLGVEERTVVVDHLKDHTVGEGTDVELLQESGLRGGDLVSGGDEVGVVDHLDLSAGNLGGDLEGLEKGGLTGITTGGTLGNDDVVGGDGTDLGGSGAGVGLEDLADVAEVSVGEDETDVSAAALDELLDGGLGVFFDVFLQTLSHHGVLSHQDLGLSSQGLTGVLELF
mmetsp:Transcript_11969/g.25291  ORF Transcript_11969/g.25291 Transcript_11969/m.25291 type:complete len:318 (+) Transcript_11969:52-1005(+)